MAVVMKSSVFWDMLLLLLLCLLLSYAAFLLCILFIPCSFETIDFQQTAQCNIPEDRTLH